MFRRVASFAAIGVIVLGLGLGSCNLFNLFDQPTVEVQGFSLVGLPGEFTTLDIDVLITNTDRRNGNIGDVTYTVVIEGIESEEMTYALDEMIISGEPLAATLPLTIATEGAAILLDKLEKDGSLDYTVTGSFHEVDKNLELPIDVSGAANVDVGYDDYFAQPEVTVNEVTGTYTINGFTSYTFDLEVDCAVFNKADYGATIDEVEYIVYLEGIPSEMEVYTPAPEIELDATDGSAGGGDTVESLLLPVEFNTTPVDGAALAAGMADSIVDYVVEGTFHATADLGDGEVEFYLPLYVTGQTTASVVQN